MARPKKENTSIKKEDIINQEEQLNLLTPETQEIKEEKEKLEDIITEYKLNYLNRLNRKELQDIIRKLYNYCK